jgi:hypothetical protein
VREASGDDRMRTWIYYRILEPRFDRLVSAMPNCDVSPAQAKRIATFLVGEPTPPPTLRKRVGRWLRIQWTGRGMLAAFTGGVLVGLGLFAVIGRARRRAVRHAA